MADLDIAENLGAGADHDAAPDFRMTILVLLAGTAERHIVQDRHIILDHGRFTDHEPGGVVQKYAAANLCRRIDVALKHRRSATLQVERKILAALSIEPVREPMSLDGVEALVIKHGLYETAGGWIAVNGGNNIGPEGFANRARLLHSLI